MLQIKKKYRKRNHIKKLSLKSNKKKSKNKREKEMEKDMCSRLVTLL